MCSIFFCVSFLSKKRPKTGHSKNPKNENAKKKKKRVNAVVFTNSVPNFLGVGYKNVMFCWKPYKIGVSAYFEKEKRAKNV